MSKNEWKKDVNNYYNRLIAICHKNCLNQFKWKMILTFQPDPVDDKEMGKLHNIEQSLKKEEEKLSEVTYELDGVHRVRLCH